MRLSWNGIRDRATKFANDWKDASYEKGETQSFYNDFFEVFGVKRRRVATYEQHVRNTLNHQGGFIDLFWPGVLLVEQKSKGRNLKQAEGQARTYCSALKGEEHPRYILLSDFQTFQLFDLDERTQHEFSLSALPKNVERFGFIMGLKKRVFKDQAQVNMDASELMGRVHDALEESGFRGHELEQFLVRLVFCLFADDTGIFSPRDIFWDFLESRTAEDGSDLGNWLAQLFQVLNTPEDKRPTTLDEDLAQFPYINGDLFSEQLQILSLNSAMRQSIIEACKFDWSPISPAIFGSLFQSVMDKKTRRQEGAHYTTEKNIMKVIEPLFLDDLRAEFKHLDNLKGKDRKGKLEEFHAKLGRLTFFDPACGCGNFLIIAYRELRQLEIDLLKALYKGRQQKELDVSMLSKIDVNQFYGTELNEFPVRIAETALWMMDHLMNTQLGAAFGSYFARIPLKRSPTIIHGDALEMDWAGVLLAKECDYVLGNPPFGGFVFNDKKQQQQKLELMGRLGAAGRRLDYVAAWFLKAGEYIQKNHQTKIGFVATNSITQGEQVELLWPALFERYGLEIGFAHRTFEWGSDAKGKAHVHVVIIGLAHRENEPKKKRLFVYPDIKKEPEESLHAVLTPYLTGMPNDKNKHLVVRRATKPLNGLPELRVGSKPVDGGIYIFDEAERAAFLDKEPKAEKFVRPFIGGKEYLHEGERWILYLYDAEPDVLQNLPEIRKRIAAVRKYREQGGPLAKSLANKPRSFHVHNVPDSSFLAIPETSSEKREYIPIGWLEPPTIPSNAIHVVRNATKTDFALLTSSMHMAWMRHVGGRLESRYNYSGGMVYNTFPLPPKMDDKQKEKITTLAHNILNARKLYPTSTLAHLYDPDLMPPNLRAAHTALDKAVDRLYRRTPFASEYDRMEHLFVLYERMTQPLTAPPKRRRKK